MAVWFVILAVVLGLIAQDVLAGIMGLALFSVGYAIGIIWTDGADLLPGGKLSRQESRALQLMLVAAVLCAFAALSLAIANTDTVAMIVAGFAVVASVLAGGVSTWLAIR